MLEVDALHVRRPLDLGALQRVVHGLGDREEVVAAVDDLPFRFDPEVAQQRNMRRQQFGDAAAVCGCVHMQHASADQWLGELTDPFDRARQDYVRVVVQMFFEKGNPLQQRLLQRGRTAIREAIYAACRAPWLVQTSFVEH